MFEAWCYFKQWMATENEAAALSQLALRIKTQRERCVKRPGSEVTFGWILASQLSSWDPPRPTLCQQMVLGKEEGGWRALNLTWSTKKGELNVMLIWWNWELLLSTGKTESPCKDFYVQIYLPRNSWFIKNTSTFSPAFSTPSWDTIKCCWQQL